MELNPLPILKLPIINIQNALRYFPTSELIDFAICSKVCRRVAQSIVRKHDYELSASFEHDYYVSIKPRFEPKITFRKAEMKKRETVFGGGKTASVRAPIIKTMFLWIELLSGVFKCPIYRIDFYKNACNGSIASIVTWVNNRQPSVSCSSFHGKSVDGGNQEFEFFVKKLKVTDKLKIRYFSSYDFQFDGHFEAKEIQIVGASHWFKIQNLMKSKKCTRMEINTSRIRCQDANLFLKSWLNGNFPNLCHLSINANRMSRDALMEGLKFVELNEEVHHEFVSICNGTFIQNRGLEIRQANGVRAVCVLDVRSRYEGTLFFSVESFLDGF